MNLEVNGHNVFIILLVTFLTSLILTPIVKKIAIHINAIDVPNERKVHTKPIPRLGGLAIFLAFMLGYMLYARESTMMLSVLMGSFLIILCGIIDGLELFDEHGLGVLNVTEGDGALAEVTLGHL